jgi:hypothetical protein
MLIFLRKNIQKFKKIPDRSVKIQLWRRRRRLRNFKNFPRPGGSGCIFLRKIDSAGGSADRLTPLVVFTLLTFKHFFTINNVYEQQF